MKRPTHVRPVPVLLLVAAVLMSAGCSTELNSCESRELPAKWAEAKLPLVEGASVCAYNS